ncbi:MAG: rRNA maturation RNase YbeY [Nitratireductor sp.]
MQAQNPDDIDVRCQGWPDEPRLMETIHASVTAAIETAGLKLPDGAELKPGLPVMQTCNQPAMARHRQADQCLSFPGIQPGEAAGQMLGDIVFALETLEREARLEDKLFDHHLRHLVVHGFLHLFGYDSHD